MIALLLRLGIAAAGCSDDDGGGPDGAGMLCGPDAGTACVCTPTSPPADVCDGLDNDCDPATADGSADPGVGAECEVPEPARGACRAGRVECVGRAIACSAPAPSPELCNEVDDDCDGTSDEEPTDAETWHFDNDRDGYGDAEVTIVSCTSVRGYVLDATDCDDQNPSANPEGEEVCGGGDEDCDGRTDDMDDDTRGGAPFYLDGDADGYGADADVATRCVRPTGRVDRGGDCNDSNSMVYPAAGERCMPPGVDENCNGITDEGCECASLVEFGSTWRFCRRQGTWDAAEASCVAAGGHLAAIVSQEENDWAATRVGAYSGGNAWIGLRDPMMGGTTPRPWSWPDGARASYLAFRAPEPNDDTGDEDCVHMYSSGSWNDLPCAALLPGFVCRLP